MDAPCAQTEMDFEVYIFDRRTSEAPEIKLEISNAVTFKEFREKVKQVI